MPGLMIAARASRPEECDRDMAVSRGDVGMADGVIWFEMGSACCVGDSRSPWRAEAAGKQTLAVAAGDACGGSWSHGLA